MAKKSKKAADKKLKNIQEEQIKEISEQPEENDVLDERMFQEEDERYEDMEAMSHMSEEEIAQRQKKRLKASQTETEVDEQISSPQEKELANKQGGNWKWLMFILLLILLIGGGYFGYKKGYFELAKNTVSEWLSLEEYIGDPVKTPGSVTSKAVVTAIVPERKETKTKDSIVEPEVEDLAGMINDILQEEEIVKETITQEEVLDGFKLDSDKDRIPDIIEISLETDHTNVDTDGDGKEDLDEIIQGLSPRGYGVLFYDLDDTPWLEEDGLITDAVMHMGIRGEKGNLLRPREAISRAEFLKMMLYAFEIDPASLDLSGFEMEGIDKEHESYDILAAAWSSGLITSGSPDSQVTRAEAALIINRFAKWTIPAESQFVDVDIESWYGYAVNALASKGIISPGGAGAVFQPENLLLRGQAIKMIELTRRKLIK